MDPTVPGSRSPGPRRNLALLAGAALLVALAWSSWYLAARARREAALALEASGKPAPEVPTGRLVTKPAPVPAPSIELTTADGRRFSLAAARGRVVVVHLWASWCEPCARELPGLLTLARSLAQRHPGRFELVAVSADEDPEAALRFLAAPRLAGLQTGLVVALGPGAGEVAQAFSCSGRGACRFDERRLPETYVVDQQGRIVALVVGEVDWTAPGPQHYLETLLAG